MKIILSSLMCLVLGTAQCFALKGGPNYGGPGVKTTGTYAAVMIPQDETNNSIGLFSIQIPQAGLGTGPALIFQTGQVYEGTIRGTADPDSAKFTGVLRATFPYLALVQTGTDDNGNPTFDTREVVAVAGGQVKGTITSNTNLFSLASARLTGTGDIQFSLTVNNVDSEVIYDVIGFKQTET